MTFRTICYLFEFSHVHLQFLFGEYNCIADIDFLFVPQYPTTFVFVSWSHEPHPVEMVVRGQTHDRILHIDKWSDKMRWTKLVLKV